MLFSISPSDRCGSGKTPLPQCAFKVSMFNVSAIHINSRSWLRSSSTHEPSDPPLRIVDLGGQIFRKFKGVSGRKDGRRFRAGVSGQPVPTGSRGTAVSDQANGQRQWHPGLPSDRPSPFSLNVPLAFDHCLAKVLPERPIYQRAGHVPSRRARCTYPNEMVPRLRESSGFQLRPGRYSWPHNCHGRKELNPRALC